MDLQPDGYFLPGFYFGKNPPPFTRFKLIKKDNLKSEISYFQYSIKFELEPITATFSNHLLHFYK